MSKKSIILIGSLVVSTLIIMSCVSAPSPVPPSPVAAAPGIVSPAKETWQQEWDKVVGEAKKEGKVVVASSLGPARSAFVEGLAAKYGLNLEFISGKPAELAPKVLAERRAGLYLVDMFMAGTGTVQKVLMPEGAVEPLDRALILPEVLDKKAWYGGDLFWVDPDHFQLMFLAYVHHQLQINTSLVKPGEIKSARDLVNPKWKGKIAWLDPTMSGGGQDFFVQVAETLKDMEYFRELGKQEPFFTRDGRLLVEWVARGKYPVGIGIKPEEVAEFRKAGAPINTNPLPETAFLSGAGGGLVLMNKPPHPSAAKVFINWLLSKDGQIAASKVYGAQSGREDVPTDHLDPMFIRKPGVKYTRTNTPEYEAKVDNYVELIKDMWRHLIK